MGARVGRRRAFITVIAKKERVNRWWLSGGIPAAKGAYQAIGAASVASSYINLANPGTYDLTAPRGDPTFDTATGWAGGAIQDSGTAKYLNTGFPPSAGMTCVIRFSDFVNYGFTGSSPVDNGQLRFRMEYGFGTTHFRVYYGTSTPSYKDIASTVASGTIALAGRSYYIDGVYKGIIDDSSPSPTTRNLLILAEDLAGTIRYFLNGKIQAIAYYESTLDAPTILALHTAMAALPQ